MVAARPRELVVPGLARPDRCPNFSIEGEEYFDEKDREAALLAEPPPVLAAESGSRET